MRSCVSAPAARALVGPGVRIGRDRGRPLDSELAKLVTVTTHPSAILRVRGKSEREAAMEAFVADLGSVAAWVRESASRSR